MPPRNPPPDRPVVEKPPAEMPPPDKPAASQIKPAPLKGDQEERPLPSAVGAVCVGGGGRFLILHLPRDRKLAVFDANEAKVVKYLPVAEDDVKIAAGQDKLIVALPAGNVLQRWNLATFEKEATVAAPAKGTLKTLAMGSASRGPLFLGYGGVRVPGGGLVAVDPLTFKELAFKTDGDRGFGIGFEEYPSEVRISADGRLLTAWTPNLSPSGLTTMVRQGNTWKTHYEHTSVGALLPSPDGQTVFATGRLYTAEGKPLGEQAGGFGGMVWYLPALHGPFFLSLNETKQGGQGGLSVGVHMGTERRALVTLPNIDAVHGLVDWQTGQTQPFDRHVFLIPDAQLLVVIPPSKDKLVLYRFNLEQQLDKAGLDYLYIQSRPVTTAVKGQTYTYQVGVRSRKGHVRIKLDSGPDGMKVSPEGQLFWDVPKNFSAAEADVILTVSDASGQEIFHTFKIGVRDRPEP
jgi:hypothetical protein